MINLEDNELLLRCQCHSSEHMAFLIHEPDDSRGNNLKGVDDDWFLSISLDARPFWKRVVHGFKYIFGHQSRYGAFSELVLKTEDVEKISAFITRRIAERKP